MRRPSKSNRRDQFQRPSGDPADLQSLQASRVRAEARQIEDDGLVIVTTSKAAPTISLSGFVLLVASFFVFKGAVIAWLGFDDYHASIEYLRSGSIFDQAAAFVMAPDFLSQFLAQQFKVVLS
jgi:hypothetical protein